MQRRTTEQKRWFQIQRLSNVPWEMEPEVVWRAIMDSAASLADSLGKQWHVRAPRILPQETRADLHGSWRLKGRRQYRAPKKYGYVEFNNQLPILKDVLSHQLYLHILYYSTKNQHTHSAYPGECEERNGFPDQSLLPLVAGLS